MTKPNKINGVPVALLEQFDAHQRAAQATCAKKFRYPDEHVARAAGLCLMVARPGPCFIYKCKWCRGWHLTKQEQPSYYAADFFERNKKNEM